MRPGDFRKGPHGLAALAAAGLGAAPFSGAVIGLRAQRADRIQILVRDGSGLVRVWTPLPQGAFRWPPVMAGGRKLSAGEVAARCAGLDGTRVPAVRRIPHRPRPHRIVA